MPATRYIAAPDEVRPIADSLLVALSAKGWRCRTEVPFHGNAPLTTVVLATKGHEPTWLIEPQARPSYGTHVSRLSSWLRAERAHACLSIATTPDGHVSGAMLSSLKSDGVGLLIVDSDTFSVSMKCVAPALIVHLDPGVRLGRHATKVSSFIEDFNGGNRIGAVRDICEFVEGETGKLIHKARRKGVVTKTEAQIDTYNWSTQIDVLTSAGVIDTTTKADLHSFRGARNLVDHPARSRSDALARARQLGERMLMGARLSGDLLRVSTQL